jgi:hypothetical protein
MSDYDNTNRGAIWGNKRKEKDTHPDFTGSLNVDGVEYWLNGWKRKPEAGANSPAMSFSVRLRDEPGQSQNSPDEQDLDDSIPF